jgi:ABC-type lipoprotein release transport system permease subunit
MISAIVTIAIVAGMMAGCQKEMEDEIVEIIEIE